MASDSAAEPSCEVEACLSMDGDRYERLECIGRGSFGDVYRGCGQEALAKLSSCSACA
jgi:hypothetical protein